MSLTPYSPFSSKHICGESWYLQTEQYPYASESASHLHQGSSDFAVDQQANEPSSDFLASIVRLCEEPTALDSASRLQQGPSDFADEQKANEPSGEFLESIVRVCEEDTLNQTLNNKLFSDIEARDNPITIRQDLKRGANANAKRNNLTALHLAASKGHHKIMNELLNAGADMYAIASGENVGKRVKTPMSFAIDSGSFTAVRTLMNRGYNLDYKSTDPAISRKQRTPLEEACIKKNIFLVKYFFSKRGSLDSTRQAIFKVINNFDLLTFFIDRKVDLMGLTKIKKDTLSLKHGATLLHYAAAKAENRGIVRALVNAGVDKSARNASGHTAHQNVAKAYKVYERT